MEAAAVHAQVPMPQITSEVITGLITLGLTVLGVTKGKTAYMTWRYSNGYDRRAEKGNGNTSRVLMEISETLKQTGMALAETRANDAEHRREEIRALKGIFRIQVALARKMGVENVDFIDEPGRD